MATVLHPTIGIQLSSPTQPGLSNSMLFLNKKKADGKSMNDMIAQFDRLIKTATGDADKDYDIIFNGAIKICFMLQKDSQFENCLILLQWSITAIDKFIQPLLKLEKIKDCGRCFWICALSMKRKKSYMIAEIKHLVRPALNLLLQKIHQINTKDVHTLTLTTTWCLYFSAACFYYIKNYRSVHNCAQQVICLMKEQFGEEYVKYRVGGLSYAISAAAYEEEKRYDLAIQEYQHATSVFKAAEDINDAYRKSCVVYEKSQVSQLSLTQTIKKHCCCFC